MAIDYLNNGGNVRQFIPEIKNSSLFDDEQIGEVIGFWNKKMLPQVFKWDDRSKSLITKQLDENKILTKCSEFIAQELGLATVNVVEFQQYDRGDGRENTAMPLNPSISFS